MIKFVFIMLFYTAMSYLLAYIWGTYNPDLPNRRYISINSKKIAKILICRSKGSGYVNVADRKKLAVSSLIFYVILAAVVITAVVFQFVPEIPCKEFAVPFGRRSAFYFDTLNQKLPVIFVCLTFVIQLAFIVFYGIAYKLRSKKEDRKSKRSAVVIMVICILIFVLLIGYLLYGLFFG